MIDSFKRAIKRVSSAVAKTTVSKYVQKDRYYTFKGLQLKVFTGVFHPGFFFSSKLLVKWLLTQSINRKRILELGAGSGLLSLIAAKNGAIVSASDVNPAAIENVRFNAQRNNVSITLLHSDLFDDIPATQVFDIIIINPPYYPKNPVNDYEKAWYCGEDHSYFKKLFSQLKERSDKEHYYMILADVCDVNKIKHIASTNSFELKEIYKKRNFWENNFIFSIDRIT